MLEADYWEHLEYRLCNEMYQRPGCKVLGLWCDGIEPLDYILSGSGRHIRGRCWLGLGATKQERWDFKLILKDHISNANDIYWPYFMPPDDVTGWLRIFPDEQHLKINPRAGKRKP